MTKAAIIHRDDDSHDIFMPASGSATFMKCAGIDGSPVARAVARSTEPPVMAPQAGKSAFLRRLVHPMPRTMAVTLEPSADGRSEYAAFFESLGATPNRFVLGDKTRNLLVAGDI